MSIGIYRLFASAIIFIIWATQIVSVSSTFNPEDPIYNAAIAVPFVERAADKYVGDCLAYAWVQAYDNDHPNDATQIKASDVRTYFRNCLLTAFSNLSSLDYVSSVSVQGNINAANVSGDWNEMRTNTINIRLDFNFPLSTLGYSDNIDVSYTIQSDKNMVIYDTGNVVIGSGRRQYRIVVWNERTGEVEVNGLWPR